MSCCGYCGMRYGGEYIMGTVEVFCAVVVVIMGCLNIVLVVVAVDVGCGGVVVGIGGRVGSDVAMLTVEVDP